MNSDNQSYIYINPNGVITSNPSQPILDEVVFLGRAVTYGSNIAYFAPAPININQYGDQVRKLSEICFRINIC